MTTTTTQTENTSTEKHTTSFSLDPIVFVIAQIFTFGGLIVWCYAHGKVFDAALSGILWMVYCAL